MPHIVIDNVSTRSVMFKVEVLQSLTSMGCLGSRD